MALGFSSVYREGFETVLFLQALTLEAGALTVLQGVALGFAAVVGVFFLVIALERKLPHKKMLIATGLLITWVLIVLVGQTVQTLQKVGWVPVTPIEGLELPYWAGVWLGVYPTWQGLPRRPPRAAVRDRELPRRRGAAQASPRADPRRADRHPAPGHARVAAPGVLASARHLLSGRPQRPVPGKMPRAPARSAPPWRGPPPSATPEARRLPAATGDAPAVARDSIAAAPTWKVGEHPEQLAEPGQRLFEVTPGDNVEGRIAPGDPGAAVTTTTRALGYELVDRGAHLVRLVPHDAVARPRRLRPPRCAPAASARSRRRRRAACRSR